jgi:competence protein ComEC
MRVSMAIAAGSRRAWAALPAGRWDALLSAERGRFVLWLPVFMAGGVVLYFALPAEPAAWLGAAGLLGALGLGWLARARPVAQALCRAAAAAAIGFTAAQFATWRAPAVAAIPRHAVIVSGTVRAVELLPQGRRITIARPRLDDAAPLARVVRLRLRPADSLAVTAGDRLRVRALLMAPSPPAYPGGWDLQRDAYYAGFAAYGFALGPAALVAPAPPDGFAAWLQALRETIIARIAVVLPDAPGAIAATLLTGQGAAIPAADRAAFRESGLAHLLAIAGLHIGIVIGLVFAATRGGLALSERATLHLPLKPIAAVAALLAGGGYMVLTGAHVPIIRSFGMACLVTLGVLAGRRALSLRGLALAMAGLILLAPAEVMGVSFQMSFSAVLALIAGYDALRPALARLYGNGARWRRLLGHLAALALTSALAGSFSAPFAAYHFGHIQLYFVIANMAAVPLTALWVMPAGLIALLLMPLHLEALALVPMGWGIAAILWIAHAVAAWPGAVRAVPQAPAWGLGMLALGMAWLGLWRSPLRLGGIAAILLGLLSPAFAPAPDILIAADGRLIAFNGRAGLFVEKQPGASGFTLDEWQQFLAAGPPKPFPNAAGGIACTDAACILQRHGGTATLLRGAGTAADCKAPLLISARPIRLGCQAPTRTIDRFTVWREGAQAVWLGPDGPRILTDRADRGHRPWVAMPAPVGRVPAGLVPALAE